MQFSTHAICNMCNLQHMQFATCAICNTCNLQHVQFATRVICNTCNLKHVVPHLSVLSFLRFIGSGLPFIGRGQGGHWRLYPIWGLIWSFFGYFLNRGLNWFFYQLPRLTKVLFSRVTDWHAYYLNTEILPCVIPQLWHIPSPIFSTMGYLSLMPQYHPQKEVMWYRSL